MQVEAARIRAGVESGLRDPVVHSSGSASCSAIGTSGCGDRSIRRRRWLARCDGFAADRADLARLTAARSWIFATNRRLQPATLRRDSPSL